MDNWQKMTFPEAVQVNPRVSLDKDTSYPFVDMASVNPTSAFVSEAAFKSFTGGGARFLPYDTLMARITPCLENGKIARYVPQKAASSPAFGSTEFIVIRGKEGVTDNNFAYYLTQWNEFKQFAIGQMTGSSGRQRVPVNSLKGFSFYLPPLPTQERIADILGTLDDKIELNRQMNRTLEAMARAIFKSWFVDFDPVYAKMEGRDYPLPTEVMALFPDELVESELGLIPKGWEVGKLKDIINFNPRYKLSKRVEATYLEMKVLPEKGFFPTDWRKREYTSGTRFANGDTLLARITPCLENGKTAYINFLEPDEVAWGSTEYIVMRTKSDTPNLYSYLLARNGSFRKSAIKSMTGSSGRQRVQRQTLEELKTIIAPKEIYTRFGKMIEDIFEKMTINNLENVTLTEMRDTLLPKLINGEITP